MKQALLLIAAICLISCTDNNCNYVQAKISMQVNDQAVIEKTIEGCFTFEKGDLGLIEIKDNQNRLKTSYYEESNGMVEILNIKIMDDNPVEWRKKKEHDIFYLRKGDSLIFIFGDRHSVAGKVKGSIIYTK